jgi:hypothetical protein
VSQIPDPSAFHQPAGTVPEGQVLGPNIVQQNSVYPSQHSDPQSHDCPEQVQMAA